MDILTVDDDDDDAARKRVHAAPPSCFHCGAAPATNRCSRCKAVHCPASSRPGRSTGGPARRRSGPGPTARPSGRGAPRVERPAPRGGRARAAGAESATRTASRRATFLGYCRSDAGDAGGAAAHLERAVALDPSNGDAWRELLLVRERDEGDIVAAKPSSRALVGRGTIPWVAALEAMAARSAEAAALVDAETWSDVGGQGRGPSGAHDGAVVDGSWREVVLLGAGAVDGAAPATAPSGTACPAASAIPGRRGHPEPPRAAERDPPPLRADESTVDLPPGFGRAPGGGCRIRVGADWRTWAEGRCLLFDDSFEHEVRNDTDRARVVLLLRFFHPDLAPARRGAACRDAIEAKAAAERARLAPPD
ncbi:aspartyl/asparaginyl beta-hydroxylase [Aureococcus anophagefferens]|nr:aspartyl/asparaginyl beta-hydroxylase [Aureococcus anophagefferens]